MSKKEGASKNHQGPSPISAEAKPHGERQKSNTSQTEQLHIVHATQDMMTRLRSNAVACYSAPTYQCVNVSVFGKYAQLTHARTLAQARMKHAFTHARMDIISAIASVGLQWN